MMKHVRFAVLLVPLLGLGCAAPQQKTAAPNFVIIFADDVG